MKVKQKAYASAGVDIDLGNKVKGTLPQLLAATHRPEVLGKVGGFGGLFALDIRKYRRPVLVSSVDGVGTKLKLALRLQSHGSGLRPSTRLRHETSNDRSTCPNFREPNQFFSVEIDSAQRHRHTTRGD